MKPSRPPVFGNANIAADFGPVVDRNKRPPSGQRPAQMIKRQETLAAVMPRLPKWHLLDQREVHASPMRKADEIVHFAFEVAAHGNRVVEFDLETGGKRRVDAL